MLGRTQRRLQPSLIVRHGFVILLVALVASSLTKSFVVRSFYIPSESMRNSLQVDDRILVNELVSKVIPLERGDVVVFADPGGWLPALVQQSQGILATTLGWVGTAIGVASDDLRNHLVKRVIGLPGDHVVCCTVRGALSVNDNPVAEPYLLLPEHTTRVSAEDFDVTIPAGSLWVMGDNRYNSLDSRAHQELQSHGLVPEENVVGRVFVITWPLERRSWLGR